MEIQGFELGNRYAKIFLAYHMAETGPTPQFLEFGLTHEAQYRLRNEVTERLSAIISFEAAYKAMLVGDGKLVLPGNTAYVMKYRNGYPLSEVLEKDLQLDRHFLSFA